MKLGDVLAITSEHVNVLVIDCATSDVIACYDGKNSIGVELNEKEVVNQYIQVINPSRYLWVGQLCIEIIN